MGEKAVHHFLLQTFCPCVWYCCMAPFYRADMRFLLGSKEELNLCDFTKTICCPCAGIAQQARVLDKSTNIGTALCFRVKDQTTGKLLGEPIKIEKKYEQPEVVVEKEKEVEKKRKRSGERRKRRGGKRKRSGERRKKSGESRKRS